MSQLDVAIIGGGISGLSALHYLRKNKPSLNVKIFESGTRAGGTIGTDYVDGYSFDHGPNGFLDREPLTLELCDQLGMSDLLERANDKANKRFILRQGRLREVPMSPAKFLTSDILSMRGKLRLMMEPFSPKLGDVDDESLYNFAKRHMGREAADYLIQPMVSGIFGGLADRLSLKSCFPIMAEMEEEYGSLFKAMIQKARKAKAAGKKAGGPGGPSGRLTSVRGGLYGIIERFMERYSDFVQLETTVQSISKADELYSINFENNQSTTAKHIIIATPSYIAAKITKQLSEKLSTSLGKIEYAPIAVICQGFKKTSIKHTLDGFGFLVPQKENKRILGSIWTSSIFAERAPKDHAQFRTMIGGDGDHESFKLSDKDLLSVTEADIDSIIGLNGAPEITMIYRWREGIPQYKIGHSEVMVGIEAELNNFRNIFITGNAYYGISLNDCIKQSYAVTQKI